MSISLDKHGPPPPIKPDTILGHPRGLFYLFFAELWERFSFYGMRALLTLYMVKELFAAAQNRDELAIGIYAAYGTLVYATPVLGGILADRLLGYRRSILLGGALMALGHFVLAIEHPIFFYGALALLIVGNGFFKPNISTFVGSLYKEKDPRRDAGFTIFYMGINIGAAAAPLACGYLGEVYGWHYGFGLAGIGMLLGLLAFWNGLKNNAFGDKGLSPNPDALEQTKFGLKVKHLVPIASLLAVPFIAIMIFRGNLMGLNFDGSLVNILFYYVLLPIIAIRIIMTMAKIDKEARQKLTVAVILTFFMTVFWSFFELSGSAITLFADRNVDLQVLNASQTNFINPAFIVIFSLVFSQLWVYLAKVKLNPYSPIKFSMGIAQLGLGFFIFAYSANFANSEGMVPEHFLVLGYLFISTGELCLSPVGLSKITQLSAKTVVSFMMGVWFLSSAFAFSLGGFIGKFMAIENTDGGAATGMDSLMVYTGTFQSIALVAFGFAALALVLTPLMRKWMHGVH
jgi:POT family proton-dependent oligopeptide transporter